jgi:CxxC-x17-CxxC domain-containing protein
MLRVVVVRDINVGSETSRRRVWGQKPGQLGNFTIENIKVMCALVERSLGSRNLRIVRITNTSLKGKRDFYMYNDKNLLCKDCGNEFVYTAGEQEFYAEKGFQNEPARCKDCRTARKNASGDRGAKRERVMYDATCAECGCETQVPFKPTSARPVYCKNCFDARR